MPMISVVGPSLGPRGGSPVESWTYQRLFDVDRVGLRVLLGDGAAGHLVANQRALYWEKKNEVSYLVAFGRSTELRVSLSSKLELS